MTLPGRILLLSIGAAGFVLSSDRIARAQTTEPAGSGAGLPIKVDGNDVSKMSKIEDASLEGLLNLNLEDRLGQTEAVSRTSESILRAPATITTMDATQIRLTGATTVPDVLRYVPGVAVVRNAPGNYVVSLRGTGGLASNNIILLIDGIAINNPLDGAVSWDLIPLNVEDIERIEVVRGPVSPTYGANAYTGVINIVSRTTIGLSPSYAARVRGGTDPKGDTAGSVSGRFIRIGEKMDFKWFLSAGHDNTSMAPATPTNVVHDGHPGADHLATTMVLALRPNQTSDLSFELGAVWSRRSSMDHIALDSERLSQNLLFGRALYELHDPVGPKSDIRFWAQGISVGMASEHSAQTGFSYDGASALRGVVGTDVAVPLPGSLTLQLGGQGALERIEAPFINPGANGAARPTYGFYGGLKATPSRSLDIIVTGRGDLAPIAANLEYSGRASAIYHANTWGLRLTGATAFRTPTYVEAAGRFIDPTTQLILLEGTDTIRSPRNTSVELGAIFAPHSRLTVSPTVYVSRLSNLMVEDFESIVRRTFHNSPNPRTFLGAEFEANWRVRDAVSVLPSLGYLHSLDSTQSDTTNVGVPTQNSRYVGGLRVQGIFGNDRWGYGLGGTVASARSYDVRAGIPPITLAKDIPTTVHVNAIVEHQMWQARPIWMSLRLAAGLPGNSAESPLPLAAPMGQSIFLGLGVRGQ